MQRRKVVQAGFGVNHVYLIYDACGRWIAIQENGKKALIRIYYDVKSLHNNSIELQNIPTESSKILIKKWLKSDPDVSLVFTAHQLVVLKFMCQIGNINLLQIFAS